MAQQGKYDGLCGLYSVVNAFALLYPGASSEQLAELAKELAMALPKDEFRDIWLNGMVADRLTKLVEKATRFTEPWLQSGERVYTESITPNDRRQCHSQMKKKHDEATAQRQKSCFIVGFGGKCDHWTVVSNVTDKQYQLYDSDSMKRINKSATTVSSKPTQDYALDDVWHLVRR